MSQPGVSGSSLVSGVIFRARLGPLLLLGSLSVGDWVSGTSGFSLRPGPGPPGPLRSLAPLSTDVYFIRKMQDSSLRSGWPCLWSLRPMGLPSLPDWGLWDLWGVPLVRARDSGASGISLWAGLGSLGPLGTDVYFIGKTLDSSQVQNAEQLSAGGA